MKIPNKRELQQTAMNHSSDIIFKDFMKIYKKIHSETIFFLSQRYNLIIRQFFTIQESLLERI